MSRIYRYCAVLLCILSLALKVNAKEFVVVIDPGHGGKDYGALGLNTNEKTINLDVALKLGAMLNSKLDNVKVVYTRKTDVYLTLQQRADIANKASGDLFISIHTNSIDMKSKNRSTVKGAATYTLGLHRSNENLDVAKRENSVMVLEKDYTTTYQGFDPNSTESYIIFEIFQNAHMNQSISFARKVQSEFVKTAGREDKGVRQAGFWVLAKTSMPAALIELDFICNPVQERFLSSKDGQESMAKSIFNAVEQYKKSCDNKTAPSVQKKTVGGKKKTDTSDKVGSKKTTLQANLDDEMVGESEYKYSTRKRRSGNSSSTLQTNKSKKEKKVEPTKKKSEEKNVVKRPAEKSTPKKEDTQKVKNISKDKSDDSSKAVVYRIQFLTSLKELKPGCSEFKGLEPVFFYSDNGLYKYTYGNTPDKDEALKLLKDVKRKFKEAFIVPFKNNKRLNGE